MRMLAALPALAALLVSNAPVAMAQDFDVVNGGSTAYIINELENPSLNLVRGETYHFFVNAPGHPFFIKTVRSTGTGNAYSSGVSGNGVQTGTLTFVVPSNAPASLFYDCQFHMQMSGRINIADPPAPGLGPWGVLALVSMLAGAGAVVARRRAVSPRRPPSLL